MNRKSPLILIPFLLFMGCQVHRVSDTPELVVETPTVYSTGDSLSSNKTCAWWQHFDDPQLASLIEEALTHNLRIDEAWQRLEQARAHANITHSYLWPDVNLSAGYRYDHSLNRSAGGHRHNNNSVSAGPSLSYQVDLWGKIRHQAASSAYQEAATCEDYLATQLTISGAVAELWLSLQEQQALVTLLEEQIRLSTLQLDLVEHRFTLGQTTALQVYQQRQQLKSTELQLPDTKKAFEQTLHSLNTLLGRPPTSPLCALSPQGLPSLPALGTIGTPCTLLENRPDLKAAMNRLIAADHDVGAAIADRFPQLDLSLYYGFSGDGIGHFFYQEGGNIVARLMAPLFDQGRRKNQVAARRAATYQAVDQLSSAFLSAMTEVEDALSAEKYQLDLLKGLGEQLEISQKNLIEARTQYEEGLSDYLDVIIATRSLEGVQQSIIRTQKMLLSNRAKLYLALGGPLSCAPEHHKEVPL